MSPPSPPSPPFPPSPTQTEYGDVFRVTLEHGGAGSKGKAAAAGEGSGEDSGRVTELKIKYFDTIPVAAGLSVLRAGFLFAASEFGNHALYRFQVRQGAARVW